MSVKGSVNIELSKVCDICHKGFTQGGSLKRHRVKIHNIVEGNLGKYDQKFEPEKVACKLCNKMVGKFNIEYHTRVHNGEKPFQCDQCEYKSSSKHLLKQHKQYKHEGRERIRDEGREDCKTCWKNVKKCLMKKHEATHKMKAMKCEYCDANIKHRNSMKRHLIQVHGIVKGEIGKYNHNYERKVLKKECPICGKLVFKLKEHTLIHSNSEREKKFECTLCDKKFTHSSGLKGHTEQIHSDTYDYKCNVCDKKYKQRLLLYRHMKLHTDRWAHKCDICGKGFPLVSQLTRHKEIHNDSFDFKCNDCGKEFKAKAQLRNHMQSHKVKQIEEHKCDKCEKTYSKKASLKQHNEQVHSEIRNYKCHICTKEFKQNRILLQHLRLTHGPKTLKCEFCDKAFNVKNTLDKHVDVLHGIFKSSNNQKQSSVSKSTRFENLEANLTAISCNICDKTFKSEQSMRMHHNIHAKINPYRCETCDKTFNNSGSYHKHKKSHTESSHTCQFCDHKVTNKRSLLIHIQSKHEGKRYKCNICKNEFTQQSGLRMHIKTVHEGKKRQCNICYKEFTQTHNLKEHKNSVHGEYFEKDIKNPRILNNEEIKVEY